MHREAMIKQEFTVRGEVEWAVVRNGVKIMEGTQPNLITNAGLDNIGSYSSGSINGEEYMYAWRNWFAVGTGSAAPAVTDTALGGEVARSASNGGFTRPTTLNTVSLDSVAKTVTAEHVMTRVITFASAQNLAEFGFFPVSSGGQISVRELFRDGSGNPINLPIQPDDQLQMTHKFYITVSVNPAVQNLTLTVPTEVDPSGTLTLSGEGVYHYLKPAPTHNEWIFFFYMIYPNTQNLMFSTLLRSFSSAPDVTPSSAAGGDVNATYTYTCTMQTYSNGSYKRRWSKTYTTSEGNIDTWGWLFTRFSPSSGVNNMQGFKLCLAAAFTHKTNLRTLTLHYENSWMRA